MKRRGRQPAKTLSEAVCADGLLCALALDPCSIPRNRHFLLYTAPLAKDAHRRAGAMRRLRLLLDDMLRRGRPTVDIFAHDGGLRIQYSDESLALLRAIALEPLESSLLRCMIAGDTDVELLRVTSADRERVRAALKTLDARYGLDPERLVA